MLLQGKEQRVYLARMAADFAFTDQDFLVDESVGYPRAYAKLCRHRNLGPYSHGPPFTFAPYALQQDEVARAKELDQMFPVIDPKAKATAKTKIFVSLLWKQLNHLGNAGFDPAVIRVDPYGNVVYFHADSSSPLAWDVDHWFPRSRGGLTVPSNLRILQKQVRKNKHNKLEFLVPWWDLQAGISVNQFLSIFASSNSDFRHRAFSFLFYEGESEELNASQSVESHSFPHHFIEAKEQVGLAPAAIVVSRREPYGASSALKSLDYNRLRPPSPAIVASKPRASSLKENENPDFAANPYQAIVMARDSLKQREENAKMLGEIRKLDEEMNQLSQKNEEERLTIQDLELTLTKRRRRAEKCRRLAESQSSYRTMLEKMIRDAMHQSVIYKEQVRLNQAAINALMARLEAQKAMCDSSENELHRKYRQRDELEKQIRPEWEQARKRSRVDDTSHEETENKTILCLPEVRSRTPIHKQLRVFLEEEQKASEAGLSLKEDQETGEGMQNPAEDIARENKSIVPFEKSNAIERRFQMLEIGEGKAHKMKLPVFQERLEEEEEDEESRKERGKGNVEKWLQMLLDDTTEEMEFQDLDVNKSSRTEQIIQKLNEKYPQKERIPEHEHKGHNTEAFDANKQNIVQETDGVKAKGDEIVETETNKTPAENCNSIEVGNSSQPGVKESLERQEKSGKERGLARSDSFRAFRRIPSSPTLILKKGVDCMGKKPRVTSDDDEDEDYVAGNSFLKSSIKTIKKAMKT